jgi:MYXO-CTERM domain-containing protein
MRVIVRNASALLSAILVLVLAGAAPADTLYDATGGTLFADEGFGAAARLDDATFTNAVATPVKITAMDFGYANIGSGSQEIDALVTFWEEVNTSATGSTIVHTGNLGTFRHPIGAVAAGATGTTGLFTLASPVQVADGDVGVAIQFVLAETEDQADSVAVLNSTAPTIGTTVSGYWSDDFNTDGQFEGDEKVTPGMANPNPNFYLRLDGETVPEPVGLSLLGLAGLLLRRRRRAC